MEGTYFHINQSLRKIQLLRERFLLQSMGELGMHPNQLPILHYINHHTGCTQAEIAENLALTPAAITLATQRLQKTDLIKKEVDSQNLRRNILTLTDAGKVMLERTEEIFGQFDKQMFKDLDDAELVTFQALIDRISTNITGEATNEVSMQVMTSLLRQLQSSDTED